MAAGAIRYSDLISFGESSLELSRFGLGLKKRKLSSSSDWNSPERSAKHLGGWEFANWPREVGVLVAPGLRCIHGCRGDRGSSSSEELELLDVRGKSGLGNSEKQFVVAPDKKLHKILPCLGEVYGHQTYSEDPSSKESIILSHDSRRKCSRLHPFIPPYWFMLSDVFSLSLSRTKDSRTFEKRGVQDRFLSSLNPAGELHLGITVVSLSPTSEAVARLPK